MQEQSNTPCPKCGYKRELMHLSNAGSPGGVVIIRLEDVRKILKFKSKRISPVNALTCTYCGYTEMYATALQQLFPESYRSQH